MRSAAAPPAPPAGTATVGHRRAAAVVALGGVEATRIVRHPAFLAGLAATLALIVADPGDDTDVRVVAWAFTGMGTMLAAALCAGRSRLMGETDLFPGLPGTRADRVLATSLALAAPTLVAALAMVVSVTALHDGRLLAGQGDHARQVAPALAVWAQPVLLVALAGVVGVVVAQLRRARVAALTALVFFLFAGGGGVWALQAHPYRVLHPFMYHSYEVEVAAPEAGGTGGPSEGQPLVPPQAPGEPWHEVRFDRAALHWHLVYVAGLVLAGTWWALRAAGGGARRTRWALPAAAGLLLALGGTGQLLTAGVNP